MANKIEKQHKSDSSPSDGALDRITKLFNSLTSIIVENNKVLNALISVSVIIPFVGLILYGWSRICSENLNLDWPIDDELFAHYGDFLSGTAGILLTFISAILMYRTLNNQIESNRAFIKANGKQITASRHELEISKLQIFDSKFQMLLGQYKKNKGEYNFKKKNYTLKDIYDELYGKDPISQEWTRRLRDATMKYEEIYTEHREMLSVHFRLLYLLFCTIDTAEIDSNNKVLYAKLLRGQFSDSELLLLRYNSHTAIGKKMKNYINQYNLLKHLPFMEMIEAKEYKDLVGDPELCNALNIFYISFKKMLSEDFENKGDIDIIHSLTERCVLKFKTLENRKVLIINLDVPIQIGRGGGIKAPSMERAFVKFSEDNLKDFMIDIVYESIRYSNYERFSKFVSPLGITSSVDTRRNVKNVRAVYRSERPICMKQSQLESFPS